jgi:nucleoside 2-deoxyribosyltransferase
MMALKIYLAGPEVFLPNAREQLDRKAALVRAAGFIPLSPGDLDIPTQPTRQAFGCAISAVNEGMMREADAIIANLTPFRGLAADVGTVFELGFMCALEKHVFGYSNCAIPHFERLQSYYANVITQDSAGQSRGPDGLSLENFDMAENLMLDGGILRRGGTFVCGDGGLDADLTDTRAFEECLRLLSRKLGA